MLNKRIFSFCNKKCVRSLVQNQFYSTNRKEFNTKSDFYDNHPVDENAIKEIEEISAIRKNRGNIQIVRDLYEKYQNEQNGAKKTELKTKLKNEFKKFPNQTHPTVVSYGIDAQNVELYSYGDLHEKQIPNAKTYEELGLHSITLRLDQLGNFTGNRSYYFMHQLAELEQALIRYTTEILFKEGFELISVPDILPPEIIEGCGMPTIAENHQVCSFACYIKNV